MRANGGLKLVRTRDWMESAYDKDYQGFIDDIHFSVRGRLAFRLTLGAVALVIVGFLLSA